MTSPAEAPTTELGYAAGAGGSAYSAGGGWLYEGLEDTPELRFPASASVFDRMRRTDGQVSAILRAMTLPVLKLGRRLSADGVDPRVLRFCQAETGIGLELSGRARRRRQGIVYADHLRESLLAPVFGLAPFEQVYEVGPPIPGLEDTAPPGVPLVAHLRKLALRQPRTLMELRVARDGGLVSIVQNPPSGATDPVVIPVDRLVLYVNDKEGADWTGNSVLRAAYKHWLIKDALLRLGPMVVERNGMGVPVVTGPADGRAKGLAMARAFRAGADAGVFLEEGYRVDLVGVSGSTKDELPLVEYHDKACSRSLLAMFLDLGQTGGLGDAGIGRTFVDYFLLSLGALVEAHASTFTENVLRDLVELNYGPDEPYPHLIFDELDATAPPTADALKTLVDARLLTPDLELEQDVRRRHQLPAREGGSPDDYVPPAAPAAPFAEADVPAMPPVDLATFAGRLEHLRTRALELGVT